VVALLSPIAVLSPIIEGVLLLEASSDSSSITKAFSNSVGSGLLGFAPSSSLGLCLRGGLDEFSF
jgi:hypothetical protein